MWKPKSEKITWRRRKIHYSSSVYRNYKYVLVFFELGLDGRPKSLLLDGEEGLFVLNSPPSG